MAPTLEETLVTMASTGHIDRMKTLLGEHESPSEETIQKLLVAAAKSENLEAINFLLDQYPTVPLDEEIFRGAVNTGSISVTKALLARDPSIINMPFDHRGSALIVACMGRQRIEYLRFLLEAGADPNMDPDAAAFPIVLVAFLYTDPDAIDLLVKHGAHLEGTGALASAAQKGKEDMVLRFLQCGARPEDQAKGYSTNTGLPLNVAVSHGQLGVVRLLLEHGADPNAADRNGSKAIEVAKQMALDGKDVSNILEVLEDHGRNASSRVQTQ